MSCRHGAVRGGIRHAFLLETVDEHRPYGRP